jgi:predicted small integral membrane protein
MLTWMAWTWPTAIGFIALFSTMTVLTIMEVRAPGQSERRGILGLKTTRGDRFFLTLLGSAYIMFAWLGFIGQPVWGAILIAVAWGVFCFRKV